MPVIRQIAQMGHPVLRQISVSIPDPTDSAIRVLNEDLLATIRYSHGVGIAAPQVFESLRMVIIASHPNPRYPHAPEMEPTTLINPELLWTSEEVESGWEGCLSIPGLRGLIPRHLSVGACFQTLAGEKREVEFTGFPARVFQHEFDHLNGLLFIDRLESLHNLLTEQEFVRRTE